ncbi:hypothetical protein C8F01DRAFT_736620 [Mycena amicta]|nr:hypothetical protein C8F01DRAFT_736620 [Mycena amicta]
MRFDGPVDGRRGGARDLFVPCDSQLNAKRPEMAILACCDRFRWINPQHIQKTSSERHPGPHSRNTAQKSQRGHFLKASHWTINLARDCDLPLYLTLTFSSLVDQKSSFKFPQNAWSNKSTMFFNARFTLLAAVSIAVCAAPARRPGSVIAARHVSLKLNKRQQDQSYFSVKNRRQAASPDVQALAGHVNITTPSNGTDVTMGYLLANTTSNPMTLDASSLNWTPLSLLQQNDTHCVLQLLVNNSTAPLCATYTRAAVKAEPITMRDCDPENSQTNSSQIFRCDKDLASNAIIIKPVWLNDSMATAASQAVDDDGTDDSAQDDDVDDSDDDAADVDRRDDVQPPIMNVKLKFIPDPPTQVAQAAQATLPSSSAEPTVTTTVTVYASSLPSSTLDVQDQSSSAATSSSIAPFVAQAAQPTSSSISASISTLSTVADLSTSSSTSSYPSAVTEQAEAVFVGAAPRSGSYARQWRVL